MDYKEFLTADIEEAVANGLEVVDHSAVEQAVLRLDVLSRDWFLPFEVRACGQGVVLDGSRDGYDRVKRPVSVCAGFEEVAEHLMNAFVIMRFVVAAA